MAPALDRLASDFERATHVDDPIRIVCRYPDLADREVVALVASSLAFGRVKSVLNSIEAVLRVMGPQPAAFVRGFSPRRHIAALRPITHRWTRGEDLAALLLVIRHMLLSAGSIEAFFAQGVDPQAPDVTDALESFSSRACAVNVSDAYGGRPAGRPGLGYFFPRPAAGSACKRLNLFLRWMVRHDGIDPGGWSCLSPAQLVVPLDVHVIRVGRCLGLTRYTSPGWRMAADITRSLRTLHPDDPIKYDFALCHLGMLGECGFNQPRGDRSCPLRGLCRPRGGRRAASDAPSAPR